MCHGARPVWGGASLLSYCTQHMEVFEGLGQVVSSRREEGETRHTHVLAPHLALRGLVVVVPGGRADQRVRLLGSRGQHFFQRHVAVDRELEHEVEAVAE